MVKKKESSRIKPFTYSYHTTIIGKSKVPGSQKPSLRYINYREQWEQNPLNHIISEFPLQLDIEATGRCNLQCYYCARHSRQTDIGDMDIELFKRIINEGEKYGLCAIDPDWLGEPFLHSQLTDMIKYAKSKGVLDVRLSTNGLLVDKEMSERILDSGLNTIVFSLDATTKEDYQERKAGAKAGDFQLVNKNIEYLLGQIEKRGLRNPEVIVQMVELQQSYEEITTFIDYWKPRANKVRIAKRQNPDGRDDYDKIKSQNSHEKIFPCPQLWQRLAIAWDGTVYPCWGDNAGRMPLGNVNDTSIYEIWHGRPLADLREAHKEYGVGGLELCSHCDLNKIPEGVNHYGKRQGEKNE